MKKILTKNEGITLIALVITIIILLILAAVAIASIGGNDGMIKRSQEAKTNHEATAAEEETRLGKYEEEIDNKIKQDDGKQNGEFAIVGTYSITYKIHEGMPNEQEETDTYTFYQDETVKYTILNTDEPYTAMGRWKDNEDDTYTVELEIAEGMTDESIVKLNSRGNIEIDGEEFIRQ